MAIRRADEQRQSTARHGIMQRRMCLGRLQWLRAAASKGSAGLMHRVTPGGEQATREGEIIADRRTHRRDIDWTVPTTYPANDTSNVLE